MLIVRDPSGKQTDDYMVCTDPTVSNSEVIERFAARWSNEEAIQQAKQIGGMEKVQGWCPRTVVRQAPMAMIVVTLVTAWYVQHGVRARWAQPHGSDWTPNQDHPSYLDMAATLRKVLWTDRINCNSTLWGRVHELWRTLQFTLCAAA